MIIKILKLILLFTSIICFSQKIRWTKEYKLSSKDFSGKIPLTELESAAGSMIALNYEIASTSIWTGRIKINIFPTFDPKTSWIKSEFISEELLNHEQKHFDIAKIYSYKLQETVNKKIKDSKDFNTNFQEIYNKIYNQYFEYQQKYDQETDHGKNIEMQKKYDIEISEYLRN